MVLWVQDWQKTLGNLRAFLVKHSILRRGKVSSLDPRTAASQPPISQIAIQSHDLNQAVLDGVPPMVATHKVRKGAFHAFKKRVWSIWQGEVKLSTLAGAPWRTLWLKLQNTSDLQPKWCRRSPVALQGVATSPLRLFPQFRGWRRGVAATPPPKRALSHPIPDPHIGCRGLFGPPKPLSRSRGCSSYPCGCRATLWH